MAERRTSQPMGTHPRFGISHLGTNEAFGQSGDQNSVCLPHAQGSQEGIPHPIRDARSSPTGDRRTSSRPTAIPASGGAPSPPPRPGPGRGPFPGAEGGRRGRAAARRGRAGPLGAGGERSRGGRQRQRQGQRQRAGRGRPPAWPGSRQPAPAAPRASYASRPGAKMKGRDGSGASAHVCGGHRRRAGQRGGARCGRGASPAPRGAARQSRSGSCRPRAPSRSRHPLCFPLIPVSAVPRTRLGVLPQRFVYSLPALCDVSRCCF